MKQWQTGKKGKIKKEVGIMILIIVLTIIFFGMIIFKKNDYQIPYDSFYQQYPWLNSTTETYSQGEIPMWSNHFYSGFPTVADPQVGTFYPINILLTFFSNHANGFLPYIYVELSIVFHYILIGIFTYLLCRQLKLSRGASLMGALIFEFCGYVTGHPQHYSTILGLAWLPFCMIFLFKMAEKFKYRYLALFAIGFMLSIFAGHTQTTLYSGMALLGVTIYLTYQKFKRQEKREGKRFLLLVLLGFIISALLASIQLIPTLELMINSTREKMTFSYFSDHGNNPIYMLSTFIPYIFGSGVSWMNNEPTEQFMYLGISAIVLLIICVYNRYRSKGDNISNPISLWIGIAIISLLLSYGAETILQQFMYLVPVVNKLRRSVNYLFIFFFAISILVAYGTEMWLNKENIMNKGKVIKRLKKLLVVMIVITILSSIALFFIKHTSYYPGMLDMLKGLWISLTFTSILTFIMSLYANKEIKRGTMAGMLVIITVVDLFTFNINVSNNTQNSNANLNLSYQYMYHNADINNILRKTGDHQRAFITGIDSFNSGSIVKFSDVWGYNPLVVNHYQEFMKRIGLSYQEIGVNPNVNLSSHYLDLLSMKYLVSSKTWLSKNNTFDEEKYEKIYESGDIVVFENKKVQEMYQLTSKVEKVEDEKAILDLIEKNDYDPTEVVYSTEKLNKNYTVDNTDTIKIVKKTANTVTLDISNTNESYLICSEIYYPGWKVKINEKKATLDEINSIFRGVELSSGMNRVEMYFLPNSIIIGGVLSSLGVIILIGMYFMYRKNAKNTILH